MAASRHAFGEHAHHAGILLRTAIAADDVVVQNGFDIPALLFRHLGEMRAAVQSLLFAGHSQENNGRGKLHLAEDAGAFQADGGAAGVVVGAGSDAACVEGIAVARIVVAGDQHDAFGTLRIGALQDRINIGDDRGLRNPLRGVFGEAVGLDFEAAAAGARVAFEFGLDPFPRRADAVAGLDRIRVLRREREAGLKAHQLFDVGLNPLRRNLGQGGCDLRISGRLGFEPVRFARRCGRYGRGQHRQQRENQGNSGSKHDVHGVSLCRIFFPVTSP